MGRIIVVFSLLFYIVLPCTADARMTGLSFAMLNTDFTAAGDGTEATGERFRLIGRLGVTSITKMTGGDFEMGAGLIGSQRTAQTDVGKIHAFPVPFIPSRGHREIVFTRLPAKTKIEIFTISGELVKRLEHNAAGTDRLSWFPVTNENGSPIASGVYIWVAIDSAKNAKVGKLMVIK